MWFPDRQVRVHAREATADPAITDDRVLWTWAALDEQVDVIAGKLDRAGVAAGAVVALLGQPSALAVAGLLAILRVGAVAAPIPGGLTERELTAAAAVLRPTFVLHDAGAAPAATMIGGRRLRLEALDATTLAPTTLAPTTLAPTTLAQAPTTRVPTTRAATDPAVIVLTSGTTGRPKGVVLSGEALAASADAWRAALPPSTGWVLAVGLGHVAGLGVVWRAIAARVPVRIVPRNDPVALFVALRTPPVPSHVSLVPTQLSQLLDAGVGPPPPSLRAVLLGGGAIPPTLVERAIGAGWPVLPTYGLSEAGSGVTVLTTAEAATHPWSAGSPLPGVQIRIGDPDGAGIGEIVVHTPARFSAYLGDAADTAAVLDADGWLRTGDLGRLDRGRLTVVDRRTDRIVRGGENISPAEVETVLLAHPAIADAAVVGRPDPMWGHVPVAAIVLRNGAADPGDEVLARHCRAALAGFKVPAAFIRLRSLPRTASGKLRRGALRASIAGAPAGNPAKPAKPPESAEPPGPRWIDRPDGVRLAWHETGDGPDPILLLHGTLSNGRQLAPLAAQLARDGGSRVLAVDRRSSGASRIVGPRPLEIGVHVDDLVAILDVEGIGAAIVVGISYGGVLALELAARHPERVRAVVAWEPPYRPLADAATQARLLAIAGATEAAHRAGGPARAAETFLRGVAGDAAWDRLSPRSRAFIEQEGDGALADVLLTGLDPAGLGRIVVPLLVLTGDASEPFYAPIADALVARVPGARRIRVTGLGHAGPITDPAAVASAIRGALTEAGGMGARLHSVGAMEPAR
ncbi:MAG: alpha/beta fold hydrolase [Chloroflexota bacterium]